MTNAIQSFTSLNFEEHCPNEKHVKTLSCRVVAGGEGQLTKGLLWVTTNGFVVGG